MRLVEAKDRGFGRLANRTVNLDHKVIVTVRPNETRKARLLEVLADIVDNDAELSVPGRSRRLSVADDATAATVRCLPGRRVIASRLTEDGHAKPRDYGVPVLKALHSEFECLLRNARRGSS